MPHMNREKFLKEFLYDVEKDFDVNGTPASWAQTDQNPSAAHRFWGDEDCNIKLPPSDESKLHLNISTLSPDEKFIAAASGCVVSVHNIKTKELSMQFQGLTMPARGLVFSPLQKGTGGYTLMIASPDSDLPDSDTSFLFLELDRHGRRTVQPRLLDIDTLLQDSITPVALQLNELYGSAATSPYLNSVRAGYRQALARVQSTLEAKDLVRISGIASYRENPISSDGKLLLYRIKDKQKQGDPSQATQTTRIVVYDLVQNAQKHVIGGLTDSIAWAEFSMDARSVATVSRDGSLRISNTTSGESKHEITPPEGQYWKAEWSPDSKHILLSGLMREKNEDHTIRQTYHLAVYSSETGEQVAKYRNENITSRVTGIITAWSPRNEIAIAHEINIWIWKPFEDIISTTWSLKIDNPLMRVFANTIELMWADEGRMLIAKNCGGTIEVWDQDRNVKWRMQRPMGPGTTRRARGVHWLESSKTLVSMDMDETLRFYDL
ncbi:WD40 repeat-like protein [Aureobasidium sp. EXF-10728]|nr:WD40 repeat-like protein [Aureobasidium sp. EXF-10728]